MSRRKAFRIVLATARAVAVVSVLSVQLLTARGHTAHANGSVAIRVLGQVQQSHCLWTHPQ